MQLSQVKMFVLYGGLVIDSNYIWDGVVMWLERYLIDEVHKFESLEDLLSCWSYKKMIMNLR